jgi:hypothetical protein
MRNDTSPPPRRWRHRGYLVGLLLLLVAVPVLVEWKIAWVFTERAAFGTAAVLLLLLAAVTELLCRTAALASASHQVQEPAGAPACAHSPSAPTGAHPPRSEDAHTC